MALGWDIKVESLANEHNQQVEGLVSEPGNLTAAVTDSTLDCLLSWPQQSTTYTACLLSHFSCVPHVGTPWAAARQAPRSMGILQATILEWVARPSSWGASQPRD